MPDEKNGTSFIHDVKQWAAFFVALLAVVGGSQFLGGTPNETKRDLADTLSVYLEPMLKQVQQNRADGEATSARLDSIEKKADTYATKEQVELLTRTIMLGLSNLDDQNNRIRRQLDSMITNSP